MSKAKSYLLTLIAWLLFKFISLVSPTTAELVFALFKTYFFHSLVAVLAGGVLGMILIRLTTKKLSEKRLRAERYLDRYWIVVGSVAFAAIAVHVVETGDYFKLVLTFLIPPISVLYEQWDKFVDRYADYPNQK